MFLLSASSAYACTCVRERIKLKGFSGQVFAITRARPDNKEIFPNAEIRLMKDKGNAREIIAFLTTDENGKFSLENVKPGNYVLETSAKNFQTVLTEIKIERASKQKPEELIIGLDPNVMDCCVGYIKIKKRK